MIIYSIKMCLFILVEEMIYFIITIISTWNNYKMYIVYYILFNFDRKMCFN